MIDYSLQLFYYFNLSSGLCTECEALLSRLQKPHFCGRHEIRTPRCLLSATPPPPGWGSVGHGRPPPRHAAPHSLAGRWQQSVASRPGPPAGCPGEGALPPAMGPALRRRAFVRAGSAPSSGAGREASCLEVQRRKSLGASRIKQRMDFAFNPCKYHHLFWRKKPPPVLLRAKLKVKNADCLIVVVSSGLSLCPFCEMRR